MWISKGEYISGGENLKVVMLEDVNGVGVDFSFKKGEIYKALDGDETGVDALNGTILVRQPNSPKGKDWWCQFDKSLIGEKITVIKREYIGGGDTNRV